MKKVDHPNIASVHEVIDVTSDDALLSTSFPPRSWSNLALADLCFLDSRYFMLSPILASIAFTDHAVRENSHGTVSRWTDHEADRW